MREKDVEYVPTKYSIIDPIPSLLSLQSMFFDIPSPYGLLLND